MSYVSATGQSTIAINWLFITCALVSTGVRIHSHVRQGSSLSLSEWYLLLAMISLVVNGAVIVAEVVQGGVGYHAYELDQAHLTKAMQYLLAAEVTWSLSLLAVKMSITTQYKSIFCAGHNRKFLPWCDAFQVIVCIYFVGSILFYFLSCHPLQGEWDPSFVGACHDQPAGWISTGIINVALDLLIITFPLPIITGLHASRQKRAALLITFLLGYLACGVSIARIVAIFQVDPTDVTYTEVPVVFYSVAEPVAMILCTNCITEPIAKVLCNSIISLQRLLTWGRIDPKARVSPSQTYHQSSYGKGFRSLPPLPHPVQREYSAQTADSDGSTVPMGDRFAEV